jgi:hypothetical protein
VTARHEADEDAINDVLLSDNDLRDFFADAVQLCDGLLEAGVVLHVFMVTPVRTAAPAGPAARW